MIPWKFWASRPAVMLWEAVALVLGIEPTDLKPSNDQWMVGAGKLPVFSSHSFPSQQKQTDFDKALRLAERFTNIAGPIHLRTGLASGMNKRMALVSLSEVVAFFVSRECPDIPPPLLAQVATAADTTAPTVAEPPSHTPKDHVPLPLTTGNIAFCFDGLRWSEVKWKKPLGDKPKWLQSCIAIPGERGVSETKWNPVKIGAALVNQGYVLPRSVRAKFQSQPMLHSWLDSWKTYEAEYLDNL